MSIIDTPYAIMSGTGTVRDNWWAIYADKRLVSVGVWLPPLVDGIKAVRLDIAEVPTFLQILAEQARG